MKKLLIIALLASAASLSAGVLDGISNLVTDVVQIPVDAVTTAGSVATLGAYDETVTLPRYESGNRYYTNGTYVQPTAGQVVYEAPYRY